MRYLDLFYDRIGRRYILVGLVCTSAGYLTLYIARVGFRLSDLATNAAAFCVGLALSFVLNGRYVFAVKSWGAALPRFTAAFLLSYLLNLVMLLSMRRLLGPSSPWPLAMSFTVYSISFYFINRFWSFRRA